MSIKEADKKEETQDDNTTILLEATTYTKLKRKKMRKVKPSHLSLYRIWLKNQMPKGKKTVDGLLWTKETSRRKAHTSTTFYPYLGEYFQKPQHKRNQEKEESGKMGKREQEQELLVRTTPKTIYVLLLKK